MILASAMLLGAAAPSESGRWLWWGVLAGALISPAILFWLFRHPLARPMTVVTGAVAVCSLYVNLSFLVVNPSDYRFFPPFERGRNQNRNHHLGAEYYSIAGVLASGRGFADPFRAPTGPTGTATQRTPSSNSSSSIA